MSPAKRLDVEVDGMQETIRAFQGLEADLRRTANGELRQAAGQCASDLAGALRSAAAASGVPVAPLVASSIRVKSDRLPSVSLGGPRKVGATGAPAARLLWGSERGPAGDINRFAVAPNPAGYWIRPTVTRFRSSEGIAAFKRAVYQLMRKWRLV